MRLYYHLADTVYVDSLEEMAMRLAKVYDLDGVKFFTDPKAFKLLF